MSAPLVVNTRDGVCWTRRTVTSSGIALYAPEGVCGCPEFVMATLPELAEHGIVGSADVLPVPVGRLPQALSVEREREIRSLDLLALMDDRVAPVISGHLAALLDEVDGLRAQRERRRLRLIALQNDALNMRGELSPMGEGRKVPFPLGETLTPAVAWLIGRVAELEAELATANGTLDDVAEARRAESCPCPPETLPAPHQVGCLFDGVPVSPPSERLVDGPSPLFPTVAVLRELSSREEPHDSPLHHPYLKGHDLDMPGAGGA